VSTPLPRAEFAVTGHCAYLNHAAVGVLPRSTREAIDGFVYAHAQGGVLGVLPYEQRLPEFRARIGAAINAAGSQIAILRNTGDGATILAQGLDWREGDEVLLCDDEFPSNVYPWLALRRRGVVVRFVETARGRLEPDVLRRSLSSRTRVVALSWVSFSDGYRHDLAALAQVAHKDGALVVVDAIQGLGAFPLDVAAMEIDALYAGGAKWLLALQGVSFLYLRADLLDRVGLALPGWRSVEQMWDFLDYEQPMRSDASRYEGGTPNLVGALSLASSLDLLERSGIEAIARHILSLGDRLCEGLQRAGARLSTIRGPRCSSGIVTFSIPGFDSVELGRMLAQAGVVTTWRPNGIRVSPHGYSNAAEIDLLLDALADAGEGIRCFTLP